MDAVGSCPWPLLPSCGLCPSMARPTRCPATHAGGHRGAPGRGGTGPRSHSLVATCLRHGCWVLVACSLVLVSHCLRRGSGGECAGHESPGDRQLPPRPGVLLAGDLSHCPHTPSRARLPQPGSSWGCSQAVRPGRAGQDRGQAGPAVRLASGFGGQLLCRSPGCTVPWVCSVGGHHGGRGPASGSGVLGQL